MKKSLITFTNINGSNEIYSPEPASNNLPEWYIKTNSYIGTHKNINENFETTGTIKKCMPIFDAITSGYILKTPADLYINKELSEDGKVIVRYNWPQDKILDFHIIDQAPYYPLKNKNMASYPKWMNPWSIKTEPGYSCLFITPVHRKMDFTIFPGVVDTDKYFAPVNFPFILNDENFEGLIPAGTPMAQVIPFRRENFLMTLGGLEEINQQESITNILKTRFFDSYKNLFRSKREYK
jgi:hypothetical protein